MANQHFDPYYLSWDDGTFGTVNISDAEAAATVRAREFWKQGLYADVGIFEDERTQSDWEKRAQAYLDKYDKRPKPEKIPDDIADRPNDGIPYKRRKLPHVLQPGQQQARLRADVARYGQIDLKLQGLLQEFSDSPDWRQAELQAPYAKLKGQADEARVAVVKTKANLANATHLATRDAEMLKLAKEDPDFDENWRTVRRLYGEFEDNARPIADLDRDLRLARSELSLYELTKLIDEDGNLQNPDLENDPKAIELRKKIRELDAKRDRTIAVVEKKTIGSKEYKSAHVNASNKLTEKGLNIKGFNLAGRLLAAVPYDDIKTVVNVVRTGGVVDAEGNFPSPEEIRETYVAENYRSTVDALVSGAVPYTDERWAEVNARANAEKARDDAKKRESAAQRKIELNNNSLLFKGINL